VVPIILEPVRRDDVLSLLERHRAVAHCRVQRLLHSIFGLGADDRAIFFSLASYWEMNEVSRKMKVKPLTA